MSNSRDTLSRLKARREAWVREIGTNSQYAEIAPRVVAELDQEIAAWARNNRGVPNA